MSISHRQRRLRDRYEQLLRPKRCFDSPAVRLERLRRLVVLEGIPPESPQERQVHVSRCSLRGRIWKLLLGVERVDARRYGRLIGRGPARAEMEEKIENDIERTLKNNGEYHDRVPDDQLRRVLNAYVISRSTKNCRSARSGGHTRGTNRSRTTTAARTTIAAANSTFSTSSATAVETQLTTKDSHGGVVRGVGGDGLYVQGMNVLAAPLLYVMNELDAFCSFERLLTHHCPLYVKNDLRGAQEAAFLLEQVLAHVDPTLSAYLDKAYGTPHWGPVTSLPHLLSLSASKPSPLHVTLQLWDVLFACGVHMNVVFLAAHMMLARETLMGGTGVVSEDNDEAGGSGSTTTDATSAPTGVAELQNMLFECKGMPPLDPGVVVTLSMHLLSKLPDELYDRLVFHPFAEAEDVEAETRRLVAKAKARVSAAHAAHAETSRRVAARSNARAASSTARPPARQGSATHSSPGPTVTSRPSALTRGEARIAVQASRLARALRSKGGGKLSRVQEARARAAKEAATAVNQTPPSAPVSKVVFPPPRGVYRAHQFGNFQQKQKQQQQQQQQQQHEQKEHREFLLRRAKHYHEERNRKGRVQALKF